MKIGEQTQERGTTAAAIYLYNPKLLLLSTCIKFNDIQQQLEMQTATTNTTYA